VKILLDECLPLGFRHGFPQHEVHTAQWAGLKGKKNGELLRAAEDASYDVLITADKNLPHQQNLVGLKLSIVIVTAPTNQLEDLLPLQNQISEALGTIERGQIVRVSRSD
jgi:predicted nuclease of predicted toxin-antitoxin system